MVPILFQLLSELKFPCSSDYAKEKSLLDASLPFTAVSYLPGSLPFQAESRALAG